MRLEKMRTLFYFLLAALPSSHGLCTPYETEQNAVLSKQPDNLPEISNDKDGDEFAEAYVQIQNNLPISASFQLTHLTNYFGIFDNKTWYDVKSGDSTDEMKAAFEHTQTHVDYWQLLLNFASPTWSFASGVVENTLSVLDIGETLEFDIHEDAFRTRTALKQDASAPIFIPGPDFPKDPDAPTKMNSFIFVKVNNTLASKAEVQIVLNPDYGGAPVQQGQFFPTVSPGVMKDSDALPFFFEKNQTKDFIEEWYFSVKADGIGRKRTKSTPCPLRSWVGGLVLTLDVRANGWSFAWDEIGCKGSWNAPSSVEEDSEDFEIDL